MSISNQDLREYHKKQEKIKRETKRINLESLELLRHIKAHVKLDDELLNRVSAQIIKTVNNQ
jgi:hypothetical protein